MKTKILLIGLLIIASISVQSQNAWQVDGNHINGNAGILGSTNKKPIKFITNDRVRLVIESDGDAEFKKSLYVKEGLVVGDSALSVFSFPTQQGPTGDIAVTDVGKFSLGTGTLNNPMYNSEFYFGIGGSYNAYKVQIHQQGGRSNPAVLGFTNNSTLHTGTDGFVIGLPTTGLTAVLNQQEFAPIQINTGFATLPISQCRRMELSGQTISVLNNTYSNITRVAISERGEVPITIPRSLLHLGMDAPANGGGWREWMDVGAYISGGLPGWSDNMYVGLKFAESNSVINPPDKAWSDVSDAVIAWGDNGASTINPPQGPDNLRFIFATPLTSAQTGSGSYEGLEVARITPWGNMGIGASFTNNLPPQRRLDIHDPGEATGRPQLRLTQELNANPLLGNYTDFHTTGSNNSYDGDGIGLEGHLLINPRNKGNMRVVGINIIDNNSLINPNPNLALDVNGQVNIRTVDVDDQIDQVLVWDAVNGRVKRRDFPTGGTGLMDHDWYTVGTTTAPMDINDDKYTFGRIYVNVPTAYIPVFNYLQLGVYSNTGVNNKSVTSEFRNQYVHMGPHSQAAGVVSIADGTGCVDLARNYGGYFRAENTFSNYGGFFITGNNPCNTHKNYGIWAETDPNNGYAGWFEGKVHIQGHVSYVSQSSVSDSIFKKNINTYENALAKISNLNPRTFEFKTSDYPSFNLPVGNQFGFISQEVETVFPDLVSNVTIPEKYDSLGNIVRDSINYKELNYMGFIPILAQGIKELDAKTDSLASIPTEEDKDWEYIDTLGVFTGINGTNGYNKRSVYIGITPSQVPYLEKPVKFGVISTGGALGTDGEYGLVTGGFRNMMTHSNQGTSSNGIGVFTEASSNGCISANSKNYGISARADNAYENYAGYFKAMGSGSCANTNYGVYSTCPTNRENNYAGFFNGNLAYTGSLTNQSDLKLKENINAIDNSIQVITQLNPVSFNYKTSQYSTMNMPQGTNFGLIAQEVEPILPEVVSNNYFPAQFNDNGVMLSDSFSFKSIDYTKLIPHMIGAIKELAEQNQNLQNQLTQLQDIITSCCTEVRSSSVNVSTETRPLVIPAQNTTLNQNYPNPFKTITNFTYTLGESGKCELIIEDTYGRTIATLVNEDKPMGNYSTEWDASSQPVGIYFYSLKVNGKVLVKKAIKIE